MERCVLGYMKKQIQLFKPVFDIDNTLDEIRNCLELGWTGMGFKTNEFETIWSNYTGHKFNLFLNSATAGLNLAFEVLKKIEGWKQDSEVISTGLTFVSTNHAIILAGLVPVFCDVDETLTLDPNSFLKMITKKTKAAVFVGIGGNFGNLNEIKSICEHYNIKLVLDAAHMAGTRAPNGQFLSKLSDITVYSFQAVKNLPTADSGMFSTNNVVYYELAKKLSWLGIDLDTFTRSTDGYKWKYSVDEIGYKYNGNSVMAAIAIVQARSLDDHNQKRRLICKQYDELFDAAKIKQVSHPKIINQNQSSRHLYQIVVEDRDSLISWLNNKGIGVGVHYIDNTFYDVFKLYKRSNDYSRNVSTKLISLPLHLELELDDIEFIVFSIKEYFLSNLYYNN
jgi:dTDP-4-amino-4,6-dideoxygalactose transaminase